MDGIAFNHNLIKVKLNGQPGNRITGMEDFPHLARETKRHRIKSSISILGPNRRREVFALDVARMTDLFLLSHQFELLRHLNLPLALRLLRRSLHLLRVLHPESVESCARIPELHQLVLEVFLVDWNARPVGMVNVRYKTPRQSNYFGRNKNLLG